MAAACATMEPTTMARLLKRSPAQPPESWPTIWVRVMSDTTPAAWASEMPRRSVTCTTMCTMTAETTSSAEPGPAEISQKARVRKPRGSHGPVTLRARVSQSSPCYTGPHNRGPRLRARPAKHPRNGVFSRPREVGPAMLYDRARCILRAIQTQILLVRQHRVPLEEHI
jgi:hypothetical protein